MTQPGPHRHFKGGLYSVLMVGRTMGGVGPEVEVGVYVSLLTGAVVVSPGTEAVTNRHLLFEAKSASNEPLPDDAPVAVYAQLASGRVFVRCEAEFGERVRQGEVWVRRFTPVRIGGW